MSVTAGAMASGTFATALGYSLIAAVGTSLGGLLIVPYSSPSNLFIGVSNGFAAGVMLFLSFFDILQEALVVVGHTTGSLWFLAGCLVMWAMDHMVHSDSFKPLIRKVSNDIEAGVHGRRVDEKLLRTGLITVFVIFLHNVPEGLAIFFATTQNPMKLGLPLTLAITLHNMGEGLAVAGSVYSASHSKWRGVVYAAVSGLAEPLAVVIAGAFLSSYMTEYIVNCSLACVAGVMAWLSVTELIPLAISYAPDLWERSLFFGMLCTAVPLGLIDFMLG